MTDADAIKGIRKAAKQREQPTRRDAGRRLTIYARYACEAQAAGVSISQIAREAGLSRQGVYDLLAARPSLSASSNSLASGLESRGPSGVFCLG